MTLDKFSHRSIGNLFLYKQSYTHTHTLSISHSIFHATQLHANVPIVRARRVQFSRPNVESEPQVCCRKPIKVYDSYIVYIRVIVDIENSSEPYKNIVPSVYDLPIEFIRIVDTIIIPYLYSNIFFILYLNILTYDSM